MAKKEEKENKSGDISLKLGPRLLDLLAKLQQVELEDFEMEVKELELRLTPAAIATAAPRAVAPPALPAKVKPTTILEEEFTPPIEKYPGKVREVVLGATKSEGGSRSKKFIIGGADTPSFYIFEKPPVHPPVVAIDTFDIKVPLPKAIRMHAVSYTHLTLPTTPYV